jgi:hypothetical protein
MHRPASLLLAAAITLALAGCKPRCPGHRRRRDGAPAVAVDTKAADAKFADLSKRWLDGAMALSPTSATQIGDHRFDGGLDDYSAAAAQVARLLEEAARRARGMDLKSLSRENQVDASVLRNQLRYDVWTARRCSPGPGTRRSTTASPAARSTPWSRATSRHGRSA